jgi:hypothetical protein
VLESDVYMTAEGAERIRQFMRRVWPNHKCVVIDKGHHLKIVRQQDIREDVNPDSQSE